MYRTGKSGLRDIYVVGCGPSLKKFDWPYLKDKTTIAVNGSILNVPNPDFFLTADSFFTRKVTAAKFWGVETYKILVMGESHNEYPKVKHLVKEFDHRIRPVSFNGEIGYAESDFCTGQSSGFCGMQLAVILGAKRIHLLGMDFTGENEKSGNYHHLYPSNPKAWNEFFVYFSVAIESLKRHNIEVINHSPISKLNSIIGYEATDGEQKENN